MPPPPYGLLVLGRVVVFVLFFLVVVVYFVLFFLVVVVVFVFGFFVVAPPPYGFLVGLGVG